MDLKQINHLKDQINYLKQQNARIRKSLSDQLGYGIWGLEEKDSISHEELVFLFARIFRAFDIKYVKEVRTNYPDCICVKNNDEEYAIEFEPKLSSFSQHIEKNDNLDVCNCIVCWEDDLGKFHSVKDQINEHGIDTIELKKFYKENRIKNRTQSINWSVEDIMRLSENQLKILYAFIAKEKNILTKEEISEVSKINGKGLGGVLGGFPRKGSWIIRKHPRGYQFNKVFKEKVEQVLEDIGRDIGIVY